MCLRERERDILGSFSPFISCARVQISPNFGMINLPSFTFLFLTFAVGLNSEFYSLNLDSFFLFLCNDILQWIARKRHIFVLELVDDAQQNILVQHDSKVITSKNVIFTSNLKLSHWRKNPLPICHDV